MRKPLPCLRPIQWMQYVCLLGWAGQSLLASFPVQGLVLPPLIPVTAGVPVEIFYDNVAILDTVQTVEVECAVGLVGGEAWSFTAVESDFGIYPFTLRLLDASDTVLAEASSILAVNPPSASAADCRIMIIGDSLSNNGGYQTQLSNRMQAANIAFSTVGTVKRGGMWGEAYGGNSYQRYLEGPYYFRSPFVYADTGFDPDRYFNENTGGVRPTLYIIFLGINDTFSRSNGTPAEKEARIDEVMGRASTFIDGMRAAAPGSEVALVLTPAGSTKQSAFDAYYGENTYYEDRWHDMRQRLVRRSIEVFGGREAEGIHLIPVSVGIDRLLDYPATDPIHPNTSGHQRIGDMIFSWVNHYLNEQSYSRWALGAFTDEALLAGTAAKNRKEHADALPMLARYWLNLPAVDSSDQPLQWTADGLRLTHRTGAPVSLKTSTDLLSWALWSGDETLVVDGHLTHRVLTPSAMEADGHSRRFWRVDVATGE